MSCMSFYLRNLLLYKHYRGWGSYFIPIEKKMDLNIRIVHYDYITIILQIFNFCCPKINVLDLKKNKKLTLRRKDNEIFLNIRSITKISVFNILWIKISNFIFPFSCFFLSVQFEANASASAAHHILLFGCASPLQIGGIW